MHTEYFGFIKNPFSLEPDSDFFYQNSANKSVIQQLNEYIENGNGIALLVGAAGSGKTSILNEIMRRLGLQQKVISVANETRGFIDGSNDIPDEFAVFPSRSDLISTIDTLDNRLSQGNRKESRITFFFDDGHRLSEEALKKLLQLSASYAAKNQTFRIILTALPEFEYRIKKIELEPKKQREFQVYHIADLNADDVKDYINKRVKVVSYNEGTLFTVDAIKLIAKASKGSPREINKICNSTLLTASIQKSKKITNGIVHEFVSDYINDPLDIESEPQSPDPDNVGGVDQREIDENPEDEITVDTNIGEVDPQQARIRTNPSAFIADDAKKSLSSFKLAQQGDGVDDNGEREQPISTNDERNQAGLKRIAWGVAALILLGLSMVMYQRNALVPDVMQDPTNIVATNSKKALIHQQEKRGALIASPQQVPNNMYAGLYNNNKRDQLDESKIREMIRTNQIKTELAKFSPPVEYSLQPGAMARRYLERLKGHDRVASLEKIFQRANALKTRGETADAYLLYFYSAKQGHANAAFTLAQLADPRTFKNELTVLDSPSYTQARKWYQAALQAGHPNADTSLATLRAKVLEQAAFGDEDARRLVYQFD